MSGPKGLALSRRNLYVADTESHTIRRVNLDTGIITTVLGAGVRGDGPETDPLQCKLSRPHGLFAAPDGTLYVTDSEAHRIRVLRPNERCCCYFWLPSRLRFPTGKARASGDGRGCETRERCVPRSVTGEQQVSMSSSADRPKDEDTTQRQTPQNFTQTAGAVFQIIGGTISPDATCVLTDESFLAGATVVP